VRSSARASPEEHVKEYESGLKEGGIVMGVKPRTPEDRAYFDREWAARLLA
jgi:hypothetical protein